MTETSILRSSARKASRSSGVSFMVMLISRVARASLPILNLCMMLCMRIMIMVVAIPMGYIPAPMARPMPAVAHTPAAVVSPFRVLPLR